MKRRTLEELALARGGTVTVSLLPPPLDISEKAFQAMVVALARSRGWKCYHTYDSRRSAKGYPDLTMVRHQPFGGGGVIWMELKSEKGRVTQDQREWVEELRRAHQRAYVLRPSDWSFIEELLR